jgi:Ca-activated chloride channel homolog
MHTSRIVHPPTTPIFGLFVIIESKRVILPLKGVECDFSVLSGLVEVSMTQIFRQENDRALDCEYLFPLPADASVFSCEADINGRVIRAQVCERAEARKIAAEKKAAGFRTALVESERDNLFTLSLGNVQSQDLVVIRLKYFQTLRSLADTRSVEIPFCPGVRYIPGNPLLRSNRGKGTADDTDQVPDASKITPVRIDAAHPDATYIEVRGTLDGKFLAANSLTSPSHPITTDTVGNELRVTLADKGDVPDRDFVLRWTERDTEAVAPRVWLRQDGAESYALMEVRAPQVVSTERAPVDFYFLVDRSGSMEGQKWNKGVEALQSCVRVLGPNDRAMVTFFESCCQDFAEGPLPASDLLRDPQFQTIQRLGTNGGTEMTLALSHVLEVAATHSRGRDKNLVLITDAQVGNEFAILKIMKHAPDFPVHCFGIDIALNDSLLLALSRQQGGTFRSLHPHDDIQTAVSLLGAGLGCPVLLDLKLSEGWELADAKIPNLYAGQIHYLSARSTNGNTLELAARTPSSETVRIQFEAQAISNESSYLHWCHSRIQRSIAEGDVRAAVALSVQSNLVCPLTAFVAWDESEKVAVANHALVQPGMRTFNEVEMAEMPRLFKRQKWSPEAPGVAHFMAPGLTERRFPKEANAGFVRGMLGGVASDRAAQISRDGGLDELLLRRELSAVCHRLGVAGWQTLLKAIFDWIAGAKEAERAQRLKAVNELILEIRQSTEVLARVKSNAEFLEENRRRIESLLKDFIQKQQIRATSPR